MKRRLCTALALIISTLLITGCGQDNQVTGTTRSIISGEIFSTNQYLTENASDKLSAAASSPAGSASGTASASTDKTMTGLPDVIDTISRDNGGRLVLVNKLHAVSPDYYPTDMVPVDGSLSTNQGLYFKREAYDAYLKMLGDAKEAGLSFCICSTYRSYELQKTLYNNSLARNGAAYTYTYSAYPGRSEHHTGWAVDITSASMGYGLSQNFIDYPEGLWINNNCSEYGFIIRYPKGKTHITGYAYEPWHLRYVGIDAAKEITARGITLEEYLGEA